MPARGRLAVPILALALAACATPAAVPEGPPSPQPTATVDEIARPADWTDDDIDVVLPSGLHVRACEGDALLLCVHDGDRVVGDIALSTYPIDRAAGDASPAAHAQAFLDSFSEDRATGCPAFVLHGDGMHTTTLGEVPAVQTGFTLQDADGRTVERVMVVFAVADDVLWLAHVDAYDSEGGCLPPSETDLSFTPDGLARVEADLGSLLAITPLPSRT